MALKLTGRNPAKFEFDDGVSQTLVVLQPDDDSETLAAKLQRVLDLEDAQGLPVRRPGAALAAAKEEFDRQPLFDAAGAEAALAANGWADADTDNLPEA